MWSLGKSAKTYIVNGGIRCPFCNSGTISGEGFYTDNGNAWQKVECQDCGKEWKDLYTLVGIEVTEEVTKEYNLNSDDGE
jgi:transposase-like protein